MKLGRPEQFHDKFALRMRSIERSIAQYQFSAAALRKPFESTLDEHTALLLKGFGNDVNLLAAIRELLFPSRELLDAYLGRIAASTASSGTQTARDLVPFLKRLLAGDYDKMKQPIFDFLKMNASYVFHIRKFRNQIKTDPSSAEFNFNTDHFEMRMSLPVKAEDEAILPHLEIANLDEALRNRRYMSTLNLDVYFPEMLQFWRAFQSVYQESYAL
ncbi:hypothetical protein FN976_26340 [Caenimonas sedimenti]|uniref:Uncharacterized protein n=1 Tax=Caenimonas sedimenti TaxID=2596921 RepID=A0A562ZFH1_9BURK|nr:hypothetical protein [Caenimonas sedimenti]TWO66639.1 hypothetical protein FN976_26340 [Caenimonas sedimenti]